MRKIFRCRLLLQVFFVEALTFGEIQDFKLGQICRFLQNFQNSVLNLKKIHAGRAFRTLCRKLVFCKYFPLPFKIISLKNSSLFLQSSLQIHLATFFAFQ